MSSKKFNAAGFSEKLSLLNRTSDRIRSIAQWILQHKNHCFEITNVWLKAVEKADVNHRLTLFYVANDVVQLCRKQDASRYREAFANTLELAIPLANDDSIKCKIERMIGIWEDRGIYHPDFLRGLREKLNEKKPKVEEKCSASPVNLNEVGNFKANLNASLQELKKLSAVIRKQRLLEGVENFNIDIASIPSIGQTQGIEILRKLNPRISNASALVSAVEKETAQRKAVIEELEKTQKFYSQQQCDVQTVAKAYKAFGRKVKRVQKCLAEKKALFASGGTTATVSSSPSGGLSTQRGISSPVEVSSLEKRLSLLTQSNYIQEVGSEFVKSGCSPSERLAIKSPDNSIGGHKHSPSEVHSACEEHQTSTVSPQRKEEGDSSRMDVDLCSPGSRQLGGSPSSSGSRGGVVNNSSVSVQVIDLAEDKLPEEEKQSVRLPEVNIPARQDSLNEPHLHSIELPKVKSPCREEGHSNQCSVQSKDLQKAKSPTEETSATQRSNPCHSIKDMCPQSTTVAQASPPTSVGSQCLPVTNSAERDVDVTLVCPDSNTAHKGHHLSDLHKGLHVGTGNLIGNMSSCENNNSVTPNMSKGSNNFSCIKHTHGKEVSETTHSSSSSGLECSGGGGGDDDDEIVILSENLKVPPRNNCSPQFMYNVLQSVVAFTDVNCNCNLRTGSNHLSPRVRDIVNLYSLLLKKAPSNLCSRSYKKNGECEVITIADEHKENKESFENCNKVQDLLPAGAVKRQGENLAANLEVMDMDLGSSDDEMA